MNLLLGKFVNLNNSDLNYIINCYQDYFTFKTSNNEILLYLDTKNLKRYLQKGFNIKYRNFIFLSLRNNYQLNQKNTYKLYTKKKYNLNCELENIINLSNNIINNNNIFKLKDKNIIKLSNNLYANILLERFYHKQIEEQKYKYSGIIINCNDSYKNKYLSISSIIHNKNIKNIKTLQFKTKCTLILTNKDNINDWKKLTSMYNIHILNSKKIMNKDILNLDFLIININSLSKKFYKDYFKKYNSNNNLDISIINSIYDNLYNINIDTELFINLYIFNWNNIIYDNIEKIVHFDKYNFIYHLSTINVKYYLSNIFLESNIIDYIIINSITLNNKKIDISLDNLDNFYYFVNNELVIKDNYKNINVKYEKTSLEMNEHEIYIYNLLFDSDNDIINKSLFFIEYYKYNFKSSNIYDISNNSTEFCKNTLLNFDIIKHNCSICIDNIEDNNICIINCGHYFCKNCLIKYINKCDNKNDCPICRKYFDINEICNISNIKTDINNNGIKINKLINIINNEKFIKLIIITQFKKNLINNNALKNIDLATEKNVKLFNSNKDKSILICDYEDILNYNFTYLDYIIFLNYIDDLNIYIQINNKFKNNCSKFNYLYINNTFEKDIVDKIYKSI